MRRDLRLAAEVRDLRGLLFGTMLALIGVAVFASIVRHQLVTATETNAALTHRLSAMRSHEAHETAKHHREIAALRGKLADARSETKAVREDLDAALGSWKTSTVSWYGPRFYGGTTASGQRLTRTMRNVAVPREKLGELPFGTRIRFAYRGRTCVATVNDTGGFARLGRAFDLGPGTAHALGFSGVGVVKWQVAR